MTSVNEQPASATGSGDSQLAGSAEPVGPGDSPSAWARVLTDANLSRPAAQGTGGRQAAGDDLDLNIGWDRFEKLVLAIARDINGMRDVHYRRYGTPGQAQHGIDLAGRRPGGRYTVIQCKDYLALSAAELRAAVEGYLSGRRPFDADELVIAVSTPARTTQVEDVLAALRSEYPEVTIELYGAEQINDLLRDRADIVSRFWSRETAEAFCTGAPLPGVPAPPPERAAQADQVLVGPLEAANLGPALEEADRTRSHDPAGAAEVYAELATRLDSDGYSGHAYVLRRKQLDALKDAGRLDEAADIAASLAAIGLHHGDSHNPRMLSHLLDELAAGAAATLRRRQHADLVRAAVNMTTHPLGAPDGLRDALTNPTASTETVGYQPLLVLLLAETVLLDEPERLADLDSLVTAALDQISASPLAGVSDDVVLRLRLIRSEYNAAEQAALLQAASRHQIVNRHAALVNARQARRCALEGLPEEALEYWRDAVGCGIHAAVVGDAASWLYAIRNLNVLYGPWTVDLDDEHRLAQALRATGSGTLLSRVRDPREEALSALAYKNPIDAVLAARRYLIDCMVTGRWAGEQEAQELLGDLYLNNSEPQLAARYYERAHETKKLKQVVASVGDLLLDVGSLRDAPWWVVEARALLLAEQADLLDDTKAATRLIELIDLTTRVRAGEVSDGPTGSLATQAARSACALAARGSAQNAQGLLDLLADDVPREANHYRFTDEAHAHACVAIAHVHPEMRMPALTRLLDLAEADTHEALNMLTATRVLQLLGDQSPGDGSTSASESAGSGTPLDDADRGTIIRRIAALAANDRHRAQVAQYSLQPDHPDVLEHARKARDRILNRPEPDPNHVGFGSNMVPDSYLASLLGVEDQKPCLDKVLGIACDPREAASNRQDALRSARNLIADQPSNVRKQAFTLAQEFANGDHDGSHLDDMTGPSHPLSSFKINMGTSSLQGFGLELAWAAASDNEDHVWVREQAIELLRSPEPDDLHMAALMLSRLPKEVTSSIDANLLSSHENRSVRQLSAILCTREPRRYRGISTRLASDPEAGVRRTVAEGLNEAEEVDPEYATVLRDVLGGDARHSIRSVAASGGGGGRKRGASLANG